MTPPPAKDAGQGLTDDGTDRVRPLVNGLFAAIFIAVVVATTAVVWLGHADAMRDGRREAENFARVLSEYLLIRLGAVDGVLSRVVASSRRVGGPEAPDRDWAPVMRTAMTGTPGVSAIIVLDAEGNVAHSTVPQINGLSWADEPVFQSIARGHANQLTVGLPFSMIAGDQILVPIGRALIDPKGDFIGAAIATLVPAQLENFYEAFDLGPAGIAWVLLSSGDVLFRSGAGDETATVDRPEFATTGLSADGFASGPLVPGGPEYLTAYRTSRIANLVTAVSLAESDVAPTAAYRIAIAAIVVAIAGILLFFAARTINRAVLRAIEPDPDYRDAAQGSAR